MLVTGCWTVCIHAFKNSEQFYGRMSSRRLPKIILHFTFTMTLSRQKKIDGQSLKYAVGWMFEIPCDFNLKVITSFHQRYIQPVGTQVFLCRFCYTSVNVP